METLQPESPSEEHIEGIVRAVQLQPQQEQQICVGFHTNRRSEAKLLKKQQALHQQLQALLMPAGLPSDAGTSSAQHMDASSSLQAAVAQGNAGSMGTQLSPAAAMHASSSGAQALVHPSSDATGADDQQQQQQQQKQPGGLPPGAEASTQGAAGHSVRDKAAALLAVVSGGQQGLSPGDLAWLTKAGVDAGGNPQQTKELAAAGCLSVQDATSAEALLAQLSKLVHAQKQQLRALTMMVRGLGLQRFIGSRAYQLLIACVTARLYLSTRPGCFIYIRNTVMSAAQCDGGSQCCAALFWLLPDLEHICMPLLLLLSCSG
jgi:hypothetical protein